MVSGGKLYSLNLKFIERHIVKVSVQLSQVYFHEMYTEANITNDEIANPYHTIECNHYGQDLTYNKCNHFSGGFVRLICRI